MIRIVKSENAVDSMNDDRGVPKSRFGAFSDAVVAIVMTLMILELKVPADLQHMNSAQLTQALSENGPIFLAFFMSFLITAQMWASHATLLKNTTKVSPLAVQLNFLFLLFICFIPYVTALFGELGLDSHAIIPYTIVITGASTSLGLLRYVILKKSDATADRLKKQFRRITICLGLSLVSIALASILPSGSIFMIAALILAGVAPLSYRFIK